MSSKKGEKKEKKKDKGQGHDKSGSKSKDKVPPRPMDEVENALKRLPIWAHQTLEETDDPFIDDFDNDITAPIK